MDDRPNNIKIKRCSACHATAQREYNARNRDHLNALRRKKRKERGEEYRQYENGYRAANAERINERERARRYGLTVDELRELLAQHDGTCAICGTSEPDERYGQWAIDHCHDSGRIRGILCSKCNKGIGLLRDDPVVLRAAADYLDHVKA